MTPTINAATCAQCGTRLQDGDGPTALISWCSERCLAAWDAVHPEEAAKWTKVAYMTPQQLASLKAELGLGEGC